jgi:hypothetical protein
LQDPSTINGNNLNNIRHEASRHFRNKKREYLKHKINELARNIRDLYEGINAMKMDYQPRANVVKDVNGAVLLEEILCY